jgi:hypothetical protein
VNVRKVMDSTTPTTKDHWASLNAINKMSHEDMCRHWRFAEIGDKYFSDPVLFAAFQKRYKDFGGMTPEMSKRIGLNR